MTAKAMTGAEDLPVYVIYEKPRDYPKHFVVRQQIVKRDGTIADGPCELAATLEEARRLVPAGLVRFVRDAVDDPVIVETWI